MVINEEKYFFRLAIPPFEKESSAIYQFTLIAEDVTENYSSKQKHQTEFNPEWSLENQLGTKGQEKF